MISGSAIIFKPFVAGIRPVNGLTNFIVGQLSGLS
jgi:hypothetical protein